MRNLLVIISITIFFLIQPIFLAKINAKNHKYNNFILITKNEEKKKREKKIKKAMLKSLPIITNDCAFTGAKIKNPEKTENIFIVLPKKKGEEIEIIKTNFLQKPCPKKIFSSNLENQLDISLDDALKNVLPVKTKGIEENQYPNGAHKRWIIKDINPLVWGDQGQYIDIGFQVDLYYVTNPLPERKYLVIQTIGSGVTAGLMKYDNKRHRGFFQRAVTLKITHKGSPIQLIRKAPETENQDNSYSVSTGILFSLFGSYGPGNTYIQPGIMTIYQKERERSYNDFSITADPCFNGEQWTYWLSSNKGHPIDKKNVIKGLVHCSSKKYGCRSIDHIPSLAAGSLLMPNMESVYTASATQKGLVNFTCEIIQYLQDIKINKAGIALTKERSYKKTVQFSIDLEKVGN